MKKVYTLIGMTAIFVMGFGYGAEWSRRKALDDLSYFEEPESLEPEGNRHSDETRPSKDTPKVFEKKPFDESDNNEVVRYNDMADSYKESNVDKDALRATDQIEYEEELEVEARERQAAEERERQEYERRELEAAQEIARNASRPYMIEEDQLGDAGYPVSELFYFEDEEVVSTDEGYLVEDYQKMIGENKLDVYLMNLVPKSEPIYIRNDVLERDYEIHAMEMPYVDFMKKSVNSRRLERGSREQ
nr:MAG TPA: hypothetical protein [Caudoviricetes sp.]